MTGENLRERKLIYISHLYPPISTMGSFRAQRMVRELSQHGWKSLVVAGKKVVGYEFDYKLEDYSLACARRGFVDPYAPIHYLRNHLPGFLAKSSKTQSAQSEAGSEASLMAKVKTILRQAPRNLWFVSANRMPDRFLPWIPAAYAAALQLVKEAGGADAVFASVGPPTDAIVGALVAEKLGLPLVVDFRDHWSLSPIELRWPLLHGMDQAVEKAVMRRASRFTTVSGPIAEELEALHGKKTLVLPNSYDKTPRKRKFKTNPLGPFVLHTGSLYNGRRDPSVFLEGFARFALENDCGRCHFVGPDAAQVVEPIARRLGIEDRVMCSPSVDHETALKWQKDADILLMVEELSPLMRGVMTGKIFEYLGAGKPVIAQIPQDSAVSELLQHTKAGAALDTAEGVYAFLKDYKDQGEDFYKPDRDAMAYYKSSAVAGRLADMLDELVG